MIEGWVYIAMGREKEYAFAVDVIHCERRGLLGGQSGPVAHLKHEGLASSKAFLDTDADGTHVEYPI